MECNLYIEELLYETWNVKIYDTVGKLKDKDISTTQKHYIHAVKSLDTKADVFAKVLGTKAV